MSMNIDQRASTSKRTSTSQLEHRASKIWRVDNPSFKKEVYDLLLESDESDNEETIEDCLISENDFIQNHISELEDFQENTDVPSIDSNIIRSTSPDSDSSDDNEPFLELQGRRPNYYYGKNRYKWASNPPSSRVRTPQHNIVTTRAVLRLSEEKRNDPLIIWNKIFDEEMRQTILTWTNLKIADYKAKFKRANRPELIDLDMIELNAFLGLLYYSSILKSNHECSSYIFATDGTGCEIFRCCMSETRFLVLLQCLRFDNPADRTERQQNDKLAAISSIFEKFVSNSQKYYQLSEYVTVDEMLVKFRRRSHMVTNMPKKPGKYGLIIRALCDAKTYYFYNGYIYSGKKSDGIRLSEEEKKLLVPTQCVLRLTKPIHDSNRNVTADNWFSSIELVDELAKRKLTYVGTLKKNKREIPQQFQPHKSREVGSTLFGFTKDKTLCSHVPKSNKTVLMISSMHHDNNIDSITNKPEIIEFYNSTKGGVDETDKKCSIYSSSRRTRRWPMVILYRILDLCGINAHVLHNEYQSKIIERGVFLKKIARSLVVPHMQRRAIKPIISNELKMTIRRVLGADMLLDEPPSQEMDPLKRKTCRLCPPKLKRKSNYTCISCSQVICLQCSKPLCKDCQ